ncbi:MAG: cytochrome o ubiquinol oxidase subunit III [Pseudomonadota bacterium]
MTTLDTNAPENTAYEFHVFEEAHAHEDAGDQASDHAHETGTMLGFWLYLMSDCLLFGILFAVHAVLGQNYAAGPAPADLFEIEKIALATAFLLVSSITYGFAAINMQQNKTQAMTLWLLVTLAFGLGFLYLEYLEFAHLWHLGATPMASAFLSSFWILVGTHGLHVTAGCIWLIVLLVQVRMFGLTTENKRRIMCLSLFWHFLDLIWIGVFSFVYLAGVLI